MWQQDREKPFFFKSWKLKPNILDDQLMYADHNNQDFKQENNILYKIPYIRNYENLCLPFAWHDYVKAAIYWKCYREVFGFFTFAMWLFKYHYFKPILQMNIDEMHKKKFDEVVAEKDILRERLIKAEEENIPKLEDDLGKANQKIETLMQEKVKSSLILLYSAFRLSITKC